MNDVILTSGEFYRAFRRAIDPWCVEMDRALKQLGVFSSQYRSMVDSRPYRRMIGRY